MFLFYLYYFLRISHLVIVNLILINLFRIHFCSRESNSPFVLIINREYCAISAPTQNRVRFLINYINNIIREPASRCNTHVLPTYLRSNFGNQFRKWNFRRLSSDFFFQLWIIFNAWKILFFGFHFFEMSQNRFLFKNLENFPHWWRTQFQRFSFSERGMGRGVAARESFVYFII